jgi:hypothetical protein
MDDGIATPFKGVICGSKPIDGTVYALHMMSFNRNSRAMCWNGEEGVFCRKMGKIARAGCCWPANTIDNGRVI